MPINERAQSLKKYNFDCNCLPCHENWPTLEELPRKFHGLPNECYNMDSKEKVCLFVCLLYMPVEPK